MRSTLPRVRPSPWAWIADVVCGAIGGYAVLGAAGSLVGIAFMVTVGQAYRRQRLARERQRRELRARRQAATSG